MRLLGPALAILLFAPPSLLSQPLERGSSGRDRTEMSGAIREAVTAEVGASLLEPGSDFLEVGGFLSAGRNRQLRAGLNAASVFDLLHPPSFPPSVDLYAHTRISTEVSNVDGAAESVLRARGEVYMQDARWGASGGVQFGRVTNEGRTGSVWTGQVGGWRVQPWFEAGGRLSHTEFSRGVLDPSLESVDGDAYSDVEGHVTWRGQHRTTVTVGRRFGVFEGFWWVGETRLPLTRGVEIRFAGGWQPGVPERSVMADRFVSVTLSLRTGTPLRRDPPPRLEMSVRPSPSTTRMTYRDPGASRVEVRGDFTDWEAVPMFRSGVDEWELRMPALPPGLYHLMIRVDGGPWTPPPGLPAVPDGFGGFTGIWIVDPGPS